MKLNEEKCHFIVAGHKYEHIWANVGQTMIWEQNKVKLLGVNIDSKLSFNDHVTSLCVNAGRKLTALTRIARSLTTEKRRILINAFVESQFNTPLYGLNSVPLITQILCSLFINKIKFRANFNFL